MWSNSSRCRIISIYLSRTWCLYTWSCLDILITMHFFINCSTVICSPTVDYAILREATSETYAPRVYFPSYKFPIYFILQSLLSNLYHKNTKNIYLIISIRSHFCKWREGIDNPLITLVARFLFVCVGAWTRAWSPTALIPWFSKTEGNTYATIAASPFPLQGKPTQAQDVEQINSVWNCPGQNMTVSNCPVQNMTDAKRKRRV